MVTKQALGRLFRSFSVNKRETMPASLPQIASGEMSENRGKYRIFH